jgi:extradiol dioxygenase family protein
MDTSKFGIVIKVNDLDNCRIFYRDILNLGEPLIDSSFVVQFSLAENLNLTLEKNQGTFLEHASSATSWSFECNDIEALSTKLQDSGFPGLFDAITFGSSRFYKGRDPENNVFYVREKQ